MRRGPTERALGVGVVATAVACGFWITALTSGDHTGYGDWRWFHHMWEAGRVGYQRWHEIPLFNPYHCGGAPLWGNPQAQVYSPTYLMTALPFGTTLGHKLYVVLHCALGWAGMYVMSRRAWRLSALPAFFAATVWTCSGFFASHVSAGHATFISFYWMPWLLLAWRASERDVRYAVWVALLMTITITEGGHYPAPYFTLLLGLDLAVRAVQPRRAWPALRGAMVGAGLAVLLSAFRIVPIFIAMLRHPNPVPDLDSLTPAEILVMLTARVRPAEWAHRWVWPEYVGFVGWLVVGATAIGVVLALVFLVRAARGRGRVGGDWVFLLVGLALFLLILQGSAGESYPWPLLQKLPFYQSLHVPSRFRVVVTFFMAGLAGLALEALMRALARWRPPRALVSVTAGIPLLLVALAVTDLMVVTLPINKKWEGTPLSGPTASRHHLVTGPPSNYLRDYANYPLRNVGTRHCYDPVPWTLSDHLWVGDVPQARLVAADARSPVADAALGEVTRWGRTNNTIWAEVETTEPARLVFNQNFDPDWRSDQGELTSFVNLMALDLDEPGRHRVEARFAPPDLPWAVSTSLLGVALSALLWFGVGWRRRRSARRRVWSRDHQ